MAYTPTTWVTGDTVTATAMNKIENGIANAGGINVDVKMWFTDSSGTIAYEGDFTSALAKASQGIPLVAFLYAGIAPEFSSYVGLLTPAWLSAYPNQIRLYYNTTDYYLWTANGISYVD